MCKHTETSILVIPVQVAFKDPMIRGSAIHIAYRILAAFFIGMGAKTSIVENLKVLSTFNLIHLLSYLVNKYKVKLRKVLKLSQLVISF